MGGTGSLFGRSHELDLLRRQIEALEAGEGSAVLVEGVGGIGKSLLLDTALGRPNVRVLRGHGNEFGSQLALAALKDVADSLLTPSARDDLDKALAAEGRADDLSIDLTQQRVAEAIVEAVKRISEIEPLLLVVEDAHWLDPASAYAMGGLSSVFPTHPLMLVCSYRPNPKPRHLSRMLAAIERRGATFIHLAPLQDDSSKEFAEYLLDAKVGPHLTQQLQSAGGHPLLVKEMLRALQQDRLLEVKLGVAEILSTGPPPSLRITLLQRFTLLSDDELDLLKWAAVLGGPFTAGDIAGLGVGDERTVLQRLDGLVQAGLLRHENDRFAFAHDLIQEVLYQDLPHAVRSDLHSRVAKSFIQLQRPSITIAPHLQRASSQGTIEDLMMIKEIALDVRTTAPALAAELLERLIAGVDRSNPLHGEATLPLAEILLGMGRLEDARNLARRLLSSSATRSIKARATAVLVHSFYLEGDLDGALASAAHLPLTEDPSFLAAQTLLASALSYVDPARAIELGEDLVETARAAGDASAEATALAAVSGALLGQGWLDKGLEIAEQAHALAENERASPSSELNHFMTLPTALVLRNDDTAASAVLLEATRRAERSDHHWHLAEILSVSACGHFIRGEWDAALADAEASVSRSLGANFGTEPAQVAAAILSIIGVHRGDAGEGGLRAGDEDGSWPLEWARCNTLESVGDEEAAAALFATMLDREIGRDVLAVILVTGCEAVRILAKTNHPFLRQRLVDAADILAARARTPDAIAIAAYCHGAAEGDVDALHRSATLFRSNQRPFFEALVLETLIGFAPGHAESVDRCLSVYESLAASRLIERLKGEPSQDQRITGAKVGWASLTKTEARVLDLVTEGLSNAEIAETLVVSKRTVETHIAHLFQKLEVRSRPQLIAKAFRHPSPTPN